MVTLKAGKYWIGDCCYVLREELLEGFRWVDFCEQFSDNGEKIVIDGQRVVAYSTEYGDGTYQSNIGAEFPVDAGLIGAVPECLWKGEGEPFGCTLVEFKGDVQCWAENGTLTFGHVEIYTGDEEEEY